MKIFQEMLLFIIPMLLKELFYALTTCSTHLSGTSDNWDNLFIVTKFCSWANMGTIWCELWSSICIHYDLFKLIVFVKMYGSKNILTSNVILN